MTRSRITNNPFARVIYFLLSMVILSSCAGMPSLVWPTETPDPAVEAAVQSTLEAMGVNNPAKPAATAEFSSDSSMTRDAFTPNWTGLPKDCPSRAAFLKAHNLTEDMVIFHPAPTVSWRKCQEVIELKPQYYGITVIPQVNGYFYNDALADGTVTNMWGGDPKVTSVTLQWGFTATWGPANLDSPYPFVDPQNPCEILVEDARFGLYWRLPNIGLPPVEDPYYTRNGPYVTQPGNMYCEGWVPPSVDQSVPNDYLQAAALFGGLANESEWSHPDPYTWVWKYSKKVPGSATYCPDGMPCWQTVYVPLNSRGYVNIWVGDGPKKFYASDLSTLMLDNLNVDEFTAVISSNH